MATEAPAVAVKQAAAAAVEAASADRGKVQEALSNLSKVVSSGDPQLDMLLGVAALGIAVVTLIVIFLARRKNSFPLEESMLERIDQLQMIAHELKTTLARPHAELKGAIGYFRQELNEIRTHMASLSHQVSVIEQSISTLRAREQRGKYVYDAPAQNPQRSGSGARSTENLLAAPRLR